MLFSFIGAPQSGKTTIAAMAFASLKEFGFTAEFIPEIARQYIAEMRFYGGFNSLIDSDQHVIMSKQLDVETIMSWDKKTLAVSDASPFNAILYMSDTKRRSDGIKSLLKKTEAHTTHAFYLKPVKDQSTYADPNRVHSYEESLKIDSEIPGLLKEFAPDLKVTVIDGPMQMRLFQVQKVILSYGIDPD
jgi:hypothetical protein